MNGFDKAIIKNQMAKVAARLQETGLAAETIRHLNEKMREYEEILRQAEDDNPNPPLYPLQGGDLIK